MTHDAETTLKPCPFCGGVHLLECKGHTNSYVECRKCGAYGPDGPVGPVAWNTRAALDAMQPTVAEAAKVLLDAANSGTDLFDVDGMNELEGLAVKWSGNRGDAVIQLEIAEEFMRESLRALAGEDKT